MIFTTKSLIYTCATGVIGLIFYFIFGTFKIPDTNAMEITRKAGGEYIDKAFIKWLKFKQRGNIIYTYLDSKEEKSNG